MAPTVRISDATFQRIQQWAVPLVDTFDDAISKILDAADQHRGTQSREIPRFPETTDPMPGGSDSWPPREPQLGGDTDQNSSGLTVRADDLSQIFSQALEDVPTNAGNHAQSQHAAPQNPDDILRLRPEFQIAEGKRKGSIARRAYLEREGELERGVSPFAAWVVFKDGKYRYVTFSSQSSSGSWWFGVRETLVRERLRDGSLDAIILLCELDSTTVKPAQLDAPQLADRLTRDRVSRSKKGDLQFNVTRRADGALYVEGERIRQGNRPE